MAGGELSVLEIKGRESLERSDLVAVEEPLEIRIGFRDGARRRQQTISITMRTPGEDAELASGFLFTEGMLEHPSQVRAIESCKPNVVRVELADEVHIDLKRLERHFYTTSSCGVCGKTALEALVVANLVPPARSSFTIDSELIHALPDRLRAAQPVFEKTGGLHAAALFDAGGNLLALREDVGRHNAVDKVIGTRFLSGAIPISDAGLLVSGRASFELVSKALVGGIPMLSAVGAPSSLAVDLAKRFDLTLMGFVRNRRFNIYHGEWRIGRAA